MSIAVRPRSATLVPIANVAIPTYLIALVLLAGGLLLGGIVLGLVALFRRVSNRSDERPDR